MKDHLSPRMPYMVKVGQQPHGPFCERVQKTIPVKDHQMKDAMAMVAMVPKEEGGRATSPCPRKDYAVNVYFVPAVLRINWAGISLEKALMASKPVQ